MIIANGQPDAGLYVPRDIQQVYAKCTPSHDGRPGPNYWQNHAEHRTRITLAPPSRRVQGEREIVYTNHSPDPLAFYNAPGSTIHAMKLATPIAPKGSVRIRMRWYFDLVADKGWKEGAIDETTYFPAYFFPRVTNYSDYKGWDVSPFTMGREFDNDFAAFQVEVEAPRDYVVWATGTLQNPAEVLQPAVHRQLEASYTSDQGVTLAQSADVKAGVPVAAGKTLKSVTLDTGIFVDANPGDNTWKAEPAGTR